MLLTINVFFCLSLRGKLSEKISPLVGNMSKITRIQSFSNMLFFFSSGLFTDVHSVSPLVSNVSVRSYATHILIGKVKLGKLCLTCKSPTALIEVMSIDSHSCRNLFGLCITQTRKFQGFSMWQRGTMVTQSHCLINSLHTAPTQLPLISTPAAGTHNEL